MELLPALRFGETTVTLEEPVSDESWEIVEPLLPEEPPKPRGGLPHLYERAALAGIIYIPKSGIPWRMLPQAARLR